MSNSRMASEKILILIIVAQILGLCFTSVGFSPATAEGGRVVSLVDAATGSNTITFGAGGEIMPPGGYNFTVKAMLQGATPDLYDYQVAVKYDNTSISCLSATVNQSDPNFVFFRQPSPISATQISPDPGFAMAGTTLITTTASVSQGLLAQFNFRVFKVGNFTLELILAEAPPYSFTTFVLDGSLHDYGFNAQSLNVVVEAPPVSPPIASFTFAPTNPSPNQTVLFDASISYSPAGNLASYQWDFGDNMTLENLTSGAQHAYEQSGTYNVSLTVFDVAGLNGSASSLIQVGSIPIANFTYLPEQPLAYPDSVTFNASTSHSSAGSIALYLWDFGDNSTSNSTDYNATNIYAIDGIYNVTLTVYDNDGLFSSMVQTLYVGYRPVADFTWNPQSPGANETATFDGAQLSKKGNPSDTRPESNLAFCVWDFGDLSLVNGSFANVSTAEHVYPVGGEYPVTLTVYDGFGLYGSTTHLVNVTFSASAQTMTDNTIYWIPAIAVIAVLVAVGVVLKKRQKPELARKERFRVV